MHTSPPISAPVASPPRKHLWQRAVGWLLVALVLAAVFGMYLNPDFMLTMADQVWACF